MTLREFPGALALGLLASLLAHAALYGGSHPMGGSYHTLLLQLAMLGCVGLLAAFGALAWAGAPRAADGSILATRLRQRLPGLVPLLVSTVLWFELAERIEPHHVASSSFLVALCLTAAAWALLLLARAVVRLLAGAVLAARRSPFASRMPVWTRRRPAAPRLRRSPHLRRRFARPPPIAAARA